MKMAIELYPLWLRIWHWSNALAFVMLVLTGTSLHFAGSGGLLIPFNTARLLHNFFGIWLTVGFVAYLVGNRITGNGRHYRPVFQGLFERLVRQALFYGSGLFLGEHHPFPPTADAKFNPLQQVTYLAVMFGAMPLLILTGLLFLFPEWLPDQLFGIDPLWPLAVGHYLIGLFLTLFMFGHIYLATVGETLTSEFKKMLFGSKLWEEKP